jgi:hypothetical protein
MPVFNVESESAIRLDTGVFVLEIQLIVTLYMYKRAA